MNQEPRVIYQGDLYRKAGPTIRLVLSLEDEDDSHTVDVEVMQRDAMGVQIWYPLGGSRRDAQERSALVIGLAALATQGAREEAPQEAPAPTEPGFESWRSGYDEGHRHGAKRLIPLEDKIRRAQAAAADALGANDFEHGLQIVIAILCGDG